jgi:hypothetical protein
MVKKINEKTGEIIEYREPVTALAVPNLKNVSSVKAVAGKNPAGLNLRDHPEFNGQNFLCTKARIATGESGEFIIATGFVFPDGVEPNVEDHAVSIITGSDNVYSRIVAVMEQNAFPVNGKLRKGGRAWFYD